MNHKNRQLVASKLRALMILTGILLTVTNVIGLSLDASVIDYKQPHSSKDIPGYNYPMQSTSTLEKLLEQPMEKFDIITVNKEIFRSIAHSDKRKIQLYENWVLWLAGKFYEPLADTQMPERIVSGEGALCSEASAVFNSIAKLNGVKARFIGLDGHVVSEVQTDKGWRVVDPDYGVIYPVSFQDLKKKQGASIIRNELKKSNYDEEVINWHIQTYQSSQQAFISPVDIAISPRLYVVELASGWLKWIIPLMLLIYGLFPSLTLRPIATIR